MKKRCFNKDCKKISFDIYKYCESCLFDKKCDKDTLNQITCFISECDEIALGDYLMPSNMKACEKHQ